MKERTKRERPEPLILYHPNGDLAVTALPLLASVHVVIAGPISYEHASKLSGWLAEVVAWDQDIYARQRKAGGGKTQGIAL